MTEKLVREQTIQPALQLIERTIGRGREMTSVERGAFNALLDSAELLLGTTFPRDPHQFRNFCRRKC